MGVRGRELGAYETDGGTTYNTYVDSDRFLVADFNWVAGIAGGPFIPRNFRPRFVTGLSAATGRFGKAIVPTVAADIWTGAATTFDVEATDGTLDTMTVLNKWSERPSLP